MGGDDGGAAGRKRFDRLRVRRRDVLDGAEQLEVLGADVRDDDDVGARDGAQRRDLAEAAHPHLRHEYLRVGLQPAHRQRKPYFVVETAFGGDRPRVRAAEGGEDVLRRRLAGGADDRDDARRALRADERGEGGEGAVLIVRDERRRSTLPGVVDVLRSRVQRDEQVPGGRVSRVRDDPGDVPSGLVALEPTEPERLDLVPGERDHAPAFAPAHDVPGTEPVPRVRRSLPSAMSQGQTRATSARDLATITSVRRRVHRQPGSARRGEGGERLASHGAVVEGMDDAGDLLALLVALAGDEDDVARLRERDRPPRPPSAGPGRSRPRSRPPGARPG